MGRQEYFDIGCGLVRDLTLRLLVQGVEVIGTNAWNLDQGFRATKDEFQKMHCKKVLWRAHFVGAGKEHCQIENLTNLDSLPRPTGFKVACFPVNLKRASAGWVRPVAILK